MKKFLKILSVPLALGGFAALVWLENRRPLRCEEVATWAFLPYLLYLTYVTFSCYKFWKLNENI